MAATQSGRVGQPTLRRSAVLGARHDRARAAGARVLRPGGRVTCPSCGGPARVEEVFTLAGAPEPVEHVKVRCPRGHWSTSATDAFLADAH